MKLKCNKLKQELFFFSLNALTALIKYILIQIIVSLF